MFYFVNIEKKEAVRWAEYTARKLKEYGSSCCSSYELADSLSQDISDFVKPLEICEFEKFADVVITFGGDGTILSAARALLKTSLPILGLLTRPICE